MAKTFESFSVQLDDTKFIFATNFSGDPSRDRFGDTRRKCNIIVNRDMVDGLRAKGVKIKPTKPRENDDPATFVPEYYIPAQVKYRKRNGDPVKYPPKVYLIVGHNPKVLLDEDSVGCIDNIRVKKVNAVLSPFVCDDGTLSMYVRVMYVEQDLDDDPYADYYSRRNEIDPASDVDESEPF